jgi:glycosyltransferase involved in cell wall biosynthesis
VEALTDGGGPVVTVVVPTCNRREFLPDVVEALKAQALTSFRAVLVDDGSADDTVRSRARPSVTTIGSR